MEPVVEIETSYEVERRERMEENQKRMSELTVSMEIKCGTALSRQC